MNVHRRQARAALSDPVFTGLSRKQLKALVEELHPLWLARQESVHEAKRGHVRQRAKGAGPRFQLGFADRVVVTLAYLRTGLTHDALAALYDTSRQTITASVGEIRPLLAERGVNAPKSPGVRLRTLADAFAYADAHGITLRVDATEVRVRRPQAHRPGRRRFVSGKARANTMKATVVSDGFGHVLHVASPRPGRLHDQTMLKAEGFGALLDAYPGVHVLADNGYRGLAKHHPGQVFVPPARGPREQSSAQRAEREWERHAQSSARICVEHAIRSVKRWTLARTWIHRRDEFPATWLAIAGLASDSRAFAA